MYLPGNTIQAVGSITNGAMMDWIGALSAEMEKFYGEI